MSPAAGTLVKVYLLDDHDIVRQGLRDLLAPARDIRVVGDSGVAQGAGSAILRLGATVMVLDLHLQDGSGVQVCREVRAVDPAVQAVLVTSADDDEALAATVLAGAAGYVVKLARGSNVLDAVRRLGAGLALMEPGPRQRAAAVLRARAQAATPALSDHQLVLLDHVLAGFTDAEIAGHTRRGLPETQTDVAGLVDRLLALGPGSPELPGRTQTGGKHRRTV